MIKLKSLLFEEFFTGFEASRVGVSNYVEVFKNPLLKELKLCISGNEFPLILLDKDSYIWDRDKALHWEVMNEIGNKSGLFLRQSMLPLMIFGSTKNIGIYVTDAARHTKWYRQPEAAEQIKNHPFFRNKIIEDISYWDEDVNGKWV